MYCKAPQCNTYDTVYYFFLVMLHSFVSYFPLLSFKLLRISRKKKNEFVTDVNYVFEERRK